MAKLDYEPGSEEFLRHAQLQRRWRRMRALKRLGIGVAILAVAAGGWLALTRPWEWETVPVSGLGHLTGGSAEIPVGADCGDEVRAEIVRETDEVIEIKFEVRNRANDCGMGTTVTADRPVGDRTIIDHLTGRRVEPLSLTP